MCLYEVALLFKLSFIFLKNQICKNKAIFTHNNPPVSRIIPDCINV